MIQFANRTDLMLAVNMLVDMSAGAQVTNSPAAHARTLGDLSRLAMLRGQAFVRASGTSGSATVEIQANGVTLKTFGIDFATDPEYAGLKVIDLGSINGTAPLTVKVTCDGVGDTSTRVNAWVEVEHPVIVGV